MAKNVEEDFLLLEKLAIIITDSKYLRSTWQKHFLYRNIFAILALRQGKVISQFYSAKCTKFRTANASRVLPFSNHICVLPPNAKTTSGLRSIKFQLQNHRSWNLEPLAFFFALTQHRFIISWNDIFFALEMHKQQTYFVKFQESFRIFHSASDITLE